MSVVIAENVYKSYLVGEISVEALKGLNNAQVKRILDWVTCKFDLEKQPDLRAVDREVAPSPQPEPAATPVETAGPVVKPLKKRRGRPPAKAKPSRITVAIIAPRIAMR